MTEMSIDELKKEYAKRKEIMDDQFEKFKERWPSMFEDVYCGFDLPKGWFDIVWKLCLSLEHYYPNSNIKVAQVKEKFGSLRFYFDSDDDDKKLLSLVAKYEFATSLVCQECGTTVGVEKTPGYWIGYYCENHGPHGVKNV